MPRRGVGQSHFSQAVPPAPHTDFMKDGRRLSPGAAHWGGECQKDQKPECQLL